jgi:hypothetical protein
MSYNTIPRQYRNLISEFPQINDDHKAQLVTLWNVMMRIGGNDEQAGPQFASFIEQEFTNTTQPQIISDTIDAEIAQLEGLGQGRKKRRNKKTRTKKTRSKKRKNNKTFKRRN